MLQYQKMMNSYQDNDDDDIDDNDDILTLIIDNDNALKTTPGQLRRND